MVELHLGVWKVRVLPGTHIHARSSSCLFTSFPEPRDGPSHQQTTPVLIPCLLCPGILNYREITTQDQYPGVGTNWLSLLKTMLGSSQPFPTAVMLDNFSSRSCPCSFRSKDGVASHCQFWGTSLCVSHVLATRH